MRKNTAMDALFPRIRQLLLASTLLNPDRRWYQGDLARHLGVTPSSLQRDLAALVQAGILQSQRDGNRVYYMPDKSCPFFNELRGMLLKTLGLVDIIREALESLGNSIHIAFIYGSVVRGEESSASDVDLMVIGNIRLSQLAVALREAERKMQRPINSTLYAEEEFAGKIKKGNHFLESVLLSEKVFLKGSQHELDKITS